MVKHELVVPFSICRWDQPVPQMRVTEHGPLPRIVQVVSRPFPSGDVKGPWDVIKIRTNPGDPTCLIDVPFKEITLYGGMNTKKLYVHYAEVHPEERLRSSSYFPTDMCRYDMCQPEDYKLDIDGEPNSADQPQFRPNEPIRVVQISTSRRARFTDARWRSFGWTINYLKSRTLIGGNWEIHP